MTTLPLNQILLGDCKDVLKTIPDASVSCIICDPPYGLGNKEPTVEDIIAYLSGKTDLDVGGDFMGYNWSIPSVAIWKECYRVLKPGGHLLSFGGCRTFDLISLGIRAAGFENRDTIASFFGTTVFAWITGQGFPKSLSIEKAMLKAGVAPEISAKWSGYGSALKPSWEPILVFRKPLEEKTIAAQVLATGTGGMNIDACRVSCEIKQATAGVRTVSEDKGWGVGQGGSGYVKGTGATFTNEGRWPANILLVHSSNCKIVGSKKVPAPVINRFTDGMKPFGEGAGHGFTSEQTGDADGMEEIPVYECEEGCPVKLLDEQSGVLAPSSWGKAYVKGGKMFGGSPQQVNTKLQRWDTGGASRFFGQIQPDAPFLYTGKASPAERNRGLVDKNFDSSKFVVLREDLSEEDQEKVMAEWPSDLTEPDVPIDKKRVPESLLGFFTEIKLSINQHPTLKPLRLIEYLVKLVCPKGSTVLDPFCGSGTTCIAALNCDCNYIGIEKDPEFYDIAVRRIKSLSTEIEEKASERRQEEAFDLMFDLPQEEGK